MWISKKKFEEKIQQVREQEKAKSKQKISKLEDDVKWYRELSDAKEQSIANLEQQVADLKAQIREQTKADMTLEALNVLKSAMGNGEDIGGSYEAMKKQEDYLRDISMRGARADHNYGLLMGASRYLGRYLWQN